MSAMNTTVMTSEAKGLLSKTIRRLRAQLLEDLGEAVEREYRLGIKAEKAKLSQEAGRKRGRLEAWMEERERGEANRLGKKAGKPKKGVGGSRERLLAEVVSEAGYTLLNRLLYLRILEGTGLRGEAVVSKGWRSQSYQDFRDLAGALTDVGDDETEGYGFLMGLVFEELAGELPGLFGDVGLTSLVPVPPATLRAVIEALEDEALRSCWGDDTCLGWVYQYWNDPQREALDAKINGGGKIEPHEIASKTQMFTERYMAQWLLQNSLGQLWLAMCEKHGWQAHVRRDGVLDRLDERRAAWRVRREAEEVAADALMPIEGEQEEHWKYWVPQPLPGDAGEYAPASLRELKLLDPACGSGHFLVLALDLLVPLYREEAEHRGETWSDAQILKWILEDNLHGIDIDPRAVQIAAAALMVKARRVVAQGDEGEALVVGRMHLVAPTLHLASLEAGDPALRDLAAAIEADTGIAPALTEKLVAALQGAEHLGTLLKIDEAIAEVIRDHGARLRKLTGQRELFGSDEGGGGEVVELDESEAAERILDHLDGFLATHSRGDDLGLRLAGEQVATGVRFSRMLREGSYDLVVANPPYQGTAKMVDAKYVAKHYPRGKADLFAAFLERGLELCRPGGVSAMLTMRNWMFLKQYAALRMGLLEAFDLRLLGDFDRGAFESIPDEVVSVTVSVFRRSAAGDAASVSMQPTPLDDTTRDAGRTPRKRAATLCQAARFEFEPKAFAVIPDSPLVYWWSADFVTRYSESPKMAEIARGKEGLRGRAKISRSMKFVERAWTPLASILGEYEHYAIFARPLTTGDNTRFTRCWFELGRAAVELYPASIDDRPEPEGWVPLISGGHGRAWFEDFERVLDWKHRGLELKVNVVRKFGNEGLGWKVANEDSYFRPGIAFTTIGANFAARIHRYLSVFDGKGRSVFPPDLSQTVCALNCSVSQEILSSLNPSIDYAVGDINRLPVFGVFGSDSILEEVAGAFSLHESRRESSVEFKCPGSSPWRHAEEWAQLAVDLPEGEHVPDYVEELDLEPATDHLSFALGAALGRFASVGEGILDPMTAEHRRLIDQAGSVRNFVYGRTN